MPLENTFTVPVAIDEAWHVLQDVERIAPCMPGATLDSVEGDDFTGRVKVKLGPINLTYQGKASFIERNETAHRAVIDARGKDQRGNGTAAAVITAKLAADGDGTRVDVLTDLNITGRPAQFGRGVMVDVGNKLLAQFADRLAAQLGATEEAPSPAAAAPDTATASADQPRPVTALAGGTAKSRAEPASSAPEAIDLLGLAGGSALNRIGPPAAVARSCLSLSCWCAACAAAEDADGDGCRADRLRPRAGSAWSSQP